MAVFWKKMAGGVVLALSVVVLGWGAEGQGNGRGKTEVSGSSMVYLGQHRDTWRPLIHTTVNLSDITSIKSAFQFRTFDPEGAIFYGDTKNGEDWFVLSLKDGVPLMQISKEDMLVSVAGGPKINDGRWHMLEVSNREKFVILEVDGSDGLVVGMQSKQKQEEVMTGDLRLALGGILINKENMIVEFEPQMDGCVREGNWLNISNPWEMEADELWPCYHNIQPGSYFSGRGLALFNTSVFPFNEDDGLKIEVWSDFTQLDGPILSIRPPGQEPLFTLIVNNNTQEITITFGEEKMSVKNTVKKLLMTFMKDLVRVIQDEDESKTSTMSPVNHPEYLSTWRNGRLAVGGLLGEGEDTVDSQFLSGCLENIQVQGRRLDLDLSFKHPSISSHSCPANDKKPV